MAVTRTLCRARYTIRWGLCAAMNSWCVRGDEFLVCASRTTRFFKSTWLKRRVAISDRRMPVSNAMRTIQLNIGLEYASTVANSRLFSAAVSRRLRPLPGAGRLMFETGLNGNPIPHSLMATVNKWLSRASSSRTVLLLRGVRLPFASSSPASRASRYWATISALSAAKEYLPRCRIRACAFLCSPVCVD